MSKIIESAGAAIASGAEAVGKAAVATGEVVLETGEKIVTAIGEGLTESAANAVNAMNTLMEESAKILGNVADSAKDAVENAGETIGSATEAAQEAVTDSVAAVEESVDMDGPFNPTEFLFGDGEGVSEQPISTPLVEAAQSSPQVNSGEQYSNTSNQSQASQKSGRDASQDDDFEERPAEEWSQNDGSQHDGEDRGSSVQDGEDRASQSDDGVQDEEERKSGNQGGEKEVDDNPSLFERLKRAFDDLFGTDFSDRNKRENQARESQGQGSNSNGSDGQSSEQQRGQEQQQGQQQGQQGQQQGHGQGAPEQEQDARHSEVEGSDLDAVEEEVTTTDELENEGVTAADNKPLVSTEEDKAWAKKAVLDSEISAENFMEEREAKAVADKAAADAKQKEPEQQAVDTPAKEEEVKMDGPFNPTEFLFGDGEDKDDLVSNAPPTVESNKENENPQNQEGPKRFPPEVLEAIRGTSKAIKDNGGEMSDHDGSQVNAGSNAISAEVASQETGAGR